MNHNHDDLSTVLQKVTELSNEMKIFGTLLKKCSDAHSKLESQKPGHCSLGSPLLEKHTTAAVNQDPAMQCNSRTIATIILETDFDSSFNSSESNNEENINLN